MIADLFYVRENTRFCSWEVWHQQKMEFGAKFRKFFFDHLKHAYAAVKLNQIATAGSLNIT